MTNLTLSSVSLLDNTVSPWCSPGCSCNLDSCSGEFVAGTYHPMRGQGLMSQPQSILGQGTQRDLPTSGMLRVISLSKAACEGQRGDRAANVGQLRRGATQGCHAPPAVSTAVGDTVRLLLLLARNQDLCRQCSNTGGVFSFGEYMSLGCCPMTFEMMLQAS